MAGHEIQVGGPRLLEETGQPEIGAADAWRADGAIILHVVRDGIMIGGLKLADEIRPESRDALAALHRLGVEVVMITGDAAAVAGEVARELGIDRVFAGVRPEDKAAKVAELQHEGTAVATASTMPPPSCKPMLVSLSGRAPMWRSRRQG